MNIEAYASSMEHVQLAEGCTVLEEVRGGITATFTVTLAFIFFSFSFWLRSPCTPFLFHCESDVGLTEVIFLDFFLLIYNMVTG